MNSKLQGLSVIIPTFNRANYLYSTLVCLCNQVLDETINYEIIIIDSGSDDSEIVVNMFQQQYDITIIYKKITTRKNRSLLRNCGAELANYSTLCFLDNDILTPPDFIQTHYREHLNNNHTVALGRRKNLISFDISQLSEEALIQDFNILNQLPYYEDERIYSFNKVQPWRFVFSHSLSVDKEDFENVGGFNIVFGDYWGEEDLELGFRLQLAKCKINFLSEQVNFHQPHFEQSNKEQHETSCNSKLFIKLHNCFECELFEGFYKNFDKLYNALSKIKKHFMIPSSSIQENYDLIMGCLFSSDENVAYENMTLGAYCAKEDSSCKKILIWKTFFELPIVVQMSIISEAFRIGNYIYIEDLGLEKIKVFINLARQAGLNLSYKIQESKYIFYKKGNDISNLFVLLLPDIYEPEKRYVYSWFSAYLLKKGVNMSIHDQKKIMDIGFGDFSIAVDFQELVNSNIENCFGETKFQYIESLSMFLTKTSFDLPNSSQSYIIHDVDYSIKYDSLKYRNIDKANHFDEIFYSCLSFLSIYNVCNEFRKKTLPSCKKNSFCCFMENGYKEDGIDIVIDFFSEYIKDNQDAELIIKMPDYEWYKNGVYPFHNEASKTSKLFLIEQKQKYDYFLLVTKIKTKNLKKSVKIIKQNLNINDIVRLIDNCDSVILASRGCLVPPQIFISLLLGKRTIIGQHHKCLDLLKPYFVIIESEQYEFAEELDVPISCMNIPFVAFRMNYNMVSKNINTEYKVLPHEIEKKIAFETNNTLEKYFIYKKL